MADNIATSILSGVQMGRENKRQRTLAEYLQPAISGDQTALGQLFKVDPDTGLMAQRYSGQQTAASKESQIEELKQAAGLWQSAPPQVKQALYGRIRTLTAAVGLAPEDKLPVALDSPELEQGFSRFISSIAGPAQDNTPAAIRELQMLQANPDLAKLDMQRRTAGFDKPQFQTDADGNGWWISPGQAPRPVNGGQSVAGNLSSPIDMSGIGSSLDTLASLPGVTQTSRLRTPEHNAAVGGKLNSQHLRGTAGDYVVPGAQRADFIRQVGDLGLTAIDERDHIHVQGPHGGQAQAHGIKFPTKGNASTEDKAANWQIVQGNDGSFYRVNKLTGDKQDVGVTGSNAARIQKMEQERVEKVQGIQGSLAQTDTALDSIETLLKSPGLSKAVGMASAFPTLPGTDAANFEANLDTFKAQTFVPMVAQLKGMGALSDAEGKKLSEAVGALTTKMSEDAFRTSLNNVKTLLNNAKERANRKIVEINQAARSSYQQAPSQSDPNHDDEALIGKYL